VIASIQPGQPVIHSVEVADTQPSHEQNMIEEARIQGRKNRFFGNDGEGDNFGEAAARRIKLD